MPVPVFKDMRRAHGVCRYAKASGLCYYRIRKPRAALCPAELAHPLFRAPGVATDALPRAPKADVLARHTARNRPPGSCSCPLPSSLCSSAALSHRFRPPHRVSLPLSICINKHHPTHNSLILSRCVNSPLCSCPRVENRRRAHGVCMYAKASGLCYY